jgi:hypothetical protein
MIQQGYNPQRLHRVARRALSAVEKKIQRRDPRFKASRLLAVLDGALHWKL